jgi:hypothetical protein
MLKILVNYNHTPSWMEDDDYLIYDRSDDDSYLAGFPKEKIIKTKNIGNADYDKLSYLIENYESLPDVFLWSKSNLFKFISPEEFDKVKNNRDFTPLLTQSHKTYEDRLGPVCFYKDGIYYERNDSWYLGEVAPRYVHSWSEWADHFQLPKLGYIPFAPGGSYILTRERVHRYSRDVYQQMKDMLEYNQLPGEAQLCERSYYLLWR